MLHQPRYGAILLSVFLALSIVGCASDRSITEQTKDQYIETKVKAALVGDPDVSGTSIQVEVRNGQVQLSGFVKSQREAQRAMDLARRVDGVTTVINKMSIRS